MSTKREIADNILTTFRQYHKDRFLSRRYILRVVEEEMRMLLAQALERRKLYRERDLFTTIDCYEFEKIDTIKCDVVQFRTCKSIMKGKKKLPDMINSSYGSSIYLLSNIDQTIILKETTPTKYVRDKKRRGYKGEPAYYIRDGYPYLINTNMKLGYLEILTLDTEAAEKVNCSGFDECKPSVDYKFVGTDKLTKIAVDQAINKIKIHLQIKPDENPNNNQNII